MKTFFKYFLRTLAGLLLVILLLSVVGWIYINTHKKELLAYVKEASAKELNGEVVIGDVSATLFHTFPNMAVSLRDVSVRDSLWKDHHHELLKAEHLFASLNMLSLLTGKVVVQKILIERATIYLYTDFSGYSNTAIFRKHPGPRTKSADTSAHFPLIEIRDSKFIIEKVNRNKLFSFDIEKILCHVARWEDNGNLHLNLSLNALSHGLAFNKLNGAFINGKSITGNFPLQFNTDSKVLAFEHIALKVDEQPIELSGKFFLGIVPAPFFLVIETKNIPYKKAASFVADNIRKKLDQYDLSKPISSLSCVLDNSSPEIPTPLIRLTLKVEDDSISTPLASFAHASFSGSYNNEVKPNAGHGDDNSVLRFAAFTGVWQGMTLHCDSINITDLVHPMILCHLNSTVDVPSINNLVEDKSLDFTSGRAKLDLLYSGSLEDKGPLRRDITGTIQLDSATLTYLPRNFSLTGCSGKIRFNHQDMFVEGLHANSGSSELFMDGGVKNLFTLIDKDAATMLLNWHISSSRINLADFNGFLKKRTLQVTKKKSRVLFGETISKITNLLESCSMQMSLQSKKLVYKKFTATDLRASINLTNDAIELKDITLNHADGSIGISGSILNLPTSNPMHFQAKLSKVDVSKMLSAFDNFGQDAITGETLKGILSADIKINGILSEKAMLINDSTKGTVDFGLTDGQLIKFEPAEKISKTVFKKRDFSDIQFGNLKDRFDIAGNNITINRMEIQSTVLTMFVEGTYHMKKGADLSIQVPLSNLKGANTDSLLTNKGVDQKTGISARLRAKTGSDGKVKITWDPFKKAVKKMQKKQ